MPLKIYGLFVGFPPSAQDISAEGLGRLLAAFIKGGLASGHNFVIACPSWTKEPLQKLFKTEHIDYKKIEFISPKRQPALLRIYSWLLWMRTRRIKSISRRFHQPQGKKSPRYTSRVERAIWGSRSVLLLLFLGSVGSPLILTLLLFRGVRRIHRRFIFFLRNMYNLAMRAQRYLLRTYPQLQRLQKMPQNTFSGNAKESSFLLRIYQAISDREMKQLVRMVNKRRDIKVWYSPTIFWPEANEIKAPCLFCVPDVVFHQFPVAYTISGSERFLYVFNRIQQAIGSAKNFVTYSNDVKYNTLIRRYSRVEDSIFVVRHAANRLDTVLMKQRDEHDLDSYCQQQLLSALRGKLSGSQYSKTFANTAIKFFFYASQFRAHKNIISLLRAYEYLLRKRYIGHKLLLTGSPAALPEVEKFIRVHQLENDVLCLRGLSASQLAACYKLADIAVNPSLSEGGCPFTFTEALSVDTPVVMADIPVTREVLNQPELEPMYFDPYDWKNMAERMEWAVHHREELLAIQKPIYEQLAKRTWSDVVNEHIAIMDRIASEEAA